MRDLGTYVEEKPPQHDKDMTEDNEPSQVQRPNIPHKLDHRFRQQVTNQICALMSRHRVVPVQTREIMQDPDLAQIWEIIPHDMTLLMCHIVGALNILESLRGNHQSSSPDSSIKDGNPPPPTTPSHPPSPPWVD